MYIPVNVYESLERAVEGTAVDKETAFFERVGLSPCIAAVRKMRKETMAKVSESVHQKAE